MAVDMFLKLDGVKGESVDSTHKGQIDILSWSWGMSQSGTMHLAAGGGAGKVAIQDISVVKYVDRASPTIMKMCATGEHFKTAELIVRKAGGKKPIEYIVIKLKAVMVTAVSTGGSGGEDRLTESITLNFAEFNYEYTPQKGDGSADAKVPMGWKIAENTSA